MLLGYFKVLFGMRYFGLGFVFSLVVVFLLLSLGFLSGQEEVSEEELREEIRQIERDIAEEREFFQKFVEQENQALKERKLEREALAQEIGERIGDIRAINQEIFQLETKIKEIASFNDLVNDYLLAFARELKTSIEEGIPFEREKRAAVLSILISDLEKGAVSANEAFSRINNFLASEIALGYDSQNLKVIEKVGGLDREFELLRIGRIFFALIDGEKIVLWNLDEEGKYYLDPDQELSINQTRTIKNISAMLQGRKAPEITNIPLDVKQLLEK